MKKDALPTEYNLIDRSINATDTVLSYFPFYDNNDHEKKSKTDYLWEVWNNMNGEYAYSTTSEFSLFDGSQGDNLQVQLFLHTIRYAEQQVANFGLNPDYDYFRSYIHDYILN